MCMAHIATQAHRDAQLLGMFGSEGNDPGLWPALLFTAMVLSRLELLLRAMTEFMALLQSGSVLRFLVPLTIEGHVIAWVLGHLGPLCCWAHADLRGLHGYLGPW